MHKLFLNGSCAIKILDVTTRYFVSNTLDPTHLTDPMSSEDSIVLRTNSHTTLYKVHRVGSSLIMKVTLAYYGFTVLLYRWVVSRLTFCRVMLWW